MGKFLDKTVNQVISELNVSYFLPDIQRDYVWLNNAREKKIEQLFDSILRGYPIGTFLFWKLKKNDIETDKSSKKDSGKLNFQLYKFLEDYDVRDAYNKKIKVEQINSDDLHIVLDGQQRLTSLYIGLKGSRTLKKPYGQWENPNSFVEKKLYLNLRHTPDNENPDDNYQFEFLCPSELPPIDEENNWFKVGDILKIDKLITYARENNLDESESEILESLKQALCVTPIISYYEEEEKNLDKVLKIFIRVNSGGTVLSYSDLLMSILTANFSIDIRNMMQQTVEAFKDAGFYVFGRDQILKSCFLLTGSSHIFKLKNFSKTNISKIENNWDNITAKLFDAAQIVADFGYAYQLSSAFIISTIALYLYTNNISYSKVRKSDIEEMRMFVQNAQIKSYFTNSLDTKLTTVSNYMKKAKTFQDFNVKMQETHNLEITSDDINNIVDSVAYGEPALFPILQLLYPNLDYKNTVFHIDHIYPKSKFTAKNTLLPEAYRPYRDYLYNLQLLAGPENIAKKDKDPNVWINENFKKDEEKKRYKLDNYIDADFSLDWDKIQEFDEMRTRNLKKKLLSIFGLTD